MDGPLVSIIIPVYNAVETLDQSIKSVLLQSYSNIELILIDGDSNDGSVDLIKSHQSKVAFFISEKDKGVYDAINKGLDKAKGEWIYILGADDELADKNVLERAMAVANEKVELLYGDIENLDRKHPLTPRLHVSSFDQKLFWKNTLHQQGAFYHCSVFFTFRFDSSLKVLADYDLHLLMLDEKVPSHSLGMVVALCGASGLSKNYNASLYREELKIKKRRLPLAYYSLNVPWVWMKFIYKNFL